MLTNLYYLIKRLIIIFYIEIWQFFSTEQNKKKNRSNTDDEHDTKRISEAPSVVTQAI